MTVEESPFGSVVVLRMVLLVSLGNSSSSVVFAESSSSELVAVVRSVVAVSSVVDVVLVLTRVVLGVVKVNSVESVGVGDSSEDSFSVEVGVERSRDVVVSTSVVSTSVVSTSVVSTVVVGASEVSESSEVGEALVMIVVSSTTVVSV